MALKKVSKVTPLFSKEDIATMAKEYDEIRNSTKELKKKSDNLSDKLKQGAESYGTKDDKGSFYLDTDSYIVGKVAKNSVKINQEKAVELLKAKGLNKCIKKVVSYVVDEAQVESALHNGDLTEDEVREFTEVKTTYMVSVTEKKEMAEVEQSNLKSVAKRK